MTLGDFTAFNSYLAILVFPILIIGYEQRYRTGDASYARISQVLHAPDEKKTGGLEAELKGDVEART